MTANIHDLIPQRPPMVMIDRLVSCEGPVAVARLKVREDNVFLKDGRLTESGMLEALAQTAAARTGWLMHSRAGQEKAEVPVGVIGSIKGFHLFFLPETGDEVETKVEVVHEFMNASVIKGSAMVRDKIACDVEMKIFLTEKDSR